MDGINSTGRVELRWPVTGTTTTATPGGPYDLPTLAEIEALFVAWVREARRRGCPDSAAVMTPGPDNRPRWTPDLTVVWDAGPPKVSEGTGDVVNYLGYHACEKDPQSGAGNCRCGRALEDVKHPHGFRSRTNDKRRCVCGEVAAEYPHPAWTGWGVHGPEVPLP